MIGDTELVPGDPRWHNFLPGISPLGFTFTGVEASRAVSRDVINKQYRKQNFEHICSWPRISVIV